MTLFFLTLAHASPEGKPGTAASGCTCHGDVSDRTTVLLSASAQAINPGDTVQLEAYVQSDVGTVAGVTFAASDGTLEAGENTEESRGDIVQPEPVPIVDGSARFTFVLEAPDEDTTLRVYGAGNAANDDGEKTGDRWNFAPDVEITVGTGGSPDDTDDTAPANDTGPTDTGTPDPACGCSTPSSAPFAGFLLALAGSRRRPNTGSEVKR